MKYDEAVMYCVEICAQFYASTLTRWTYVMVYGIITDNIIYVRIDTIVKIHTLEKVRVAKFTRELF